MALTDITFNQNSAVAARGNVGSLVDIMLNRTNWLNRGNVGTLTDIDYAEKMSNSKTYYQPTVGEVKAGVAYGPQLGLTGTLADGGGGGNNIVWMRSR